MLADGELSFEVVRGAGAPAFGELLSIYARSIAPREQKTRLRLAAMLTRSAYRFLLCRAGPRPVGMSVVYVARRTGVALLEYMAVDPETRGRGIGTAVFAESVRRSRVGGRRAALLVEVDAPPPGASERDQRVRRERFYRRLGCRQVEGLAYLLPLPGRGAPPSMSLFVADRRLRRVRKEVLAKWLKTIYRGVYGCRASDPRLARMLERLPALITLT